MSNGGRFKSDKPYLVEARYEFTVKYGVALPSDATRGRPDRLREWCALVRAKKKLYEGETWLTGYEHPDERKRIAERYRGDTKPDSTGRREKPDRERDP